ncbi:hypothetical protein [Herbaspirillum huttiense]
MKNIDMRSALIGAAVVALYLNYAYQLRLGDTLMQWAGPRSQGGLF